MAIMKVDGMKNYVFEPGQSKAAKDRNLYEAEQGIGLTESSEGDRNKALRLEMVLKALGSAGEKISALKGKAADLSEVDLIPLSSEVRRLKKDLKRMAMQKDLTALAYNPKALRGFEHVLSERKGFKNITGTLALIEHFQCGEIDAETLLSELEKLGVFDLS
jgi:hypothetical protein